MNRKSRSKASSPRTLAHPAAMAAAAMLLAMSLLPPAASARSEEVITAPAGVTFVSGGVSTEAVDRLRAMESDFNLKMVFALNNGEYLSDVRVQVVDSANNVVLDTRTEGPWLLARLPAGSYLVSATHARSMERRTVAVAPASLKTLDFRWPTE